MMMITVMIIQLSVKSSDGTSVKAHPTHLQQINSSIYLGFVVTVTLTHIFASSAPPRAFSSSFSFDLGMASESVDATTETSCWLNGKTSKDLSTAGWPPTRSYNGIRTSAAQLVTYLTSPRSASGSGAAAVPFFGSTLGGGALFPPFDPAVADSATSFACSDCCINKLLKLRKLKNTKCKEWYLNLFQLRIRQIIWGLRSFSHNAQGHEAVA